MRCLSLEITGYSATFRHIHLLACDRGEPKGGSVMKSRMSIKNAIWGSLSILAGALMTEGGVREAVAYRTLDGGTWNVVVGTLGALGSAVMVLAGVAFWMKWAVGRGIAVAGAVCMIPVHFAGWMLGFVGIPGLLMGVVYPAALLIVMNIKPGLGAPLSGQNRQAQEPPAPPPGVGRRRAALDVT
jgi:hypothetical protein